MPNRINMGVRFTSDDISVLMTPAVASAAQGNLKSHSFLGITEQVVEYRNVFGSGIHLQYTPVNSGVKENIILDSYSGINTFNFTISTGDYYPLYTEGEAIPFTDPSTDDTAFILGQVDARDSYTGKETDGHFTLYNSLTLTEIRPGLYTLTVTVDEEFLTDPDTVYPVVVDPTLTISATYIYDTTVYSGNPDKQTYYSSAYIVAGYHGTSGKEAIALTRAKNYFESLTYIWPNNVTSAKYKVYEGSGKTNSMTVQLCSTSAAWNQSTVTYNNLSQLKTPTDSLTINKSGWYNFNITPLVKDWLKYARGEGGYTYYRGFALKSSATGVSSKHFCSANYSGSLTPSMIINYSDVSINDVGIIGAPQLNSAGRYVHPPAWGAHVGCNRFAYKFTVPSATTYTIMSLKTYGPGTSATNTKIILYDSNYSQIAVGSPDGDYKSKIADITLSAGEYCVIVQDTDDLNSYDNTYLIINCGNVLDYNDIFNVFSKSMHDFWIIGPRDNSQRCDDYAFPNYNGPYTDLATVSFNSIAAVVKYTQIDSASANCVVVYGQGTDILHFSLISDWTTTSKIGFGFLVKHSSYNAYFTNTITSYGSVLGFLTANQ